VAWKTVRNCGSWLPEDKKQKKIICGMEGKHVVAYCRLHSPASPQRVSPKKSRLNKENIDLTVRSEYQQAVTLVLI